ncbi:MAG: rhamnulokinase [Opitutae bacterium]|nr:rhamnulokinase [Opitutae bacterium]
MPRSTRRPVHCAAVDLGATSGRVIVGTWHRATLELTEVHRFGNSFRSLGAHDYWDLPGLWHEVRTGLLAAKRRFPQLASVGVDTWGVDHVLVNAAGRLVFPTHAYRDARTQPGLQRLARDGKTTALLYAETGIPNVFYNSSLQLAETVASCPAVRDDAARCLFLPDYFNFLLSGKMENEVSIASTSQLLSVRGLRWSRPALAHFGIPARWFHRPIRADRDLGPVTGIPELRDTRAVAVPGHDTAAAFAAMPASATGDDLFISSGTWSLVGYESATPLLVPAAAAARISNERLGDGRFRPLTNVIGLWLLEQTLKDLGARPANAREWRALLGDARRLPAPARLLDVDDPAFVNPASMRAAIDAQLQSGRAERPAPPRVRRHPLGGPGRSALPTSRAAEYTRLICDSLGAGHAAAMRRFEQLSGKRFARILLVGGGAKNSLLCQATADTAGLPVHALELEGSAIGNLASQLIALGAARDLAEIRRAIAAQFPPTIYRPTPDAKIVGAALRRDPNAARASHPSRHKAAPTT